MKQAPIELLTLWLSRHNKPLKIIAVVIGLLLLPIILIYVSFFVRLPSRIWLPDLDSSMTSQSTKLVTSNIATTFYGSARVYASETYTEPEQPDGIAGNFQSQYTHLPALQIYEFQSNPLLKAHRCPNIRGVQRASGEPQAKCNYVGEFNGSPIYHTVRVGPSGRSEFYIQLKNTFIYAGIMGEGQSDPYIIKSLSMKPLSDVSSYLRQNTK